MNEHWGVMATYTILTLVSSFTPIRTLNSPLTLNNAVIFSGIVLYGTWIGVWSALLEIIIISFIFKSKVSRALANSGQVLITVWLVGTLDQFFRTYYPDYWFLTDIGLILVYWLSNTLLAAAGISYFREVSFQVIIKSMLQGGSMTYLLLMAVGEIGARFVGAYEGYSLTILLGTVLLLRSVFHQYFASISDQQKKMEEIKNLNDSFLIALAASIDARDPYTLGHSFRVAHWGRETAKFMGLPPKQSTEVYYGGIIHDIGKIGIEDNILNKEGALSKEEFERIKEHPVIGYEILKRTSVFPELLPAIRWHHERVDGTGYPDKLKGNEIPLIARILAVCDAFDAMVSDRPYRKGMSVEEALRRIQEGAGTQFDAEIAANFVTMIKSLNEEELQKIIRANNRNQEIDVSLTT
ncbi:MULTISPECIES: HD-GYP domain-containing protein [Brevibacillus]|uniref:HD-GYP domain-containing protein n=1 Tax=Brevibacillus TaxID=55080 RepID=UPI001E4D51C1|nr:MULTISPECIES: HD-GYP domain-containing protein [Brevibacillus]UED68467.1 HD-GYP domain-containing protein [Brevibacillus sp. HD3.3A]WDV94741.1 HD-GYP domain-containing protein [Brevibacillus parabrevis]